MKTYSYSDKVQFFTNKAKTAVSTKQAWYFYGKLKGVTRYMELTQEEAEHHAAYLPKLAKAIEKKFGGTTKVQKPTASASAPKLPKATQPAVSKNGRTNNALRVQAAIQNLKATISILEDIK